MKDTQREVWNYLEELDQEKVRAEILEGLLSEKKYILSKYFYNERGSRLFEQITRLPEYYPTRTEKEILRGIDLGELCGEGRMNIIELGSGDSSKISILLRNIDEKLLQKSVYYPVDFNPAAIMASVNVLKGHFPALGIQGIAADFTTQLDLLPDGENRVFCFLGSTLGNLEREEALAFMKELGSIMNAGDHLLLGLDMVKEVSVLEKAYNDEQGVTADFNKNILNSLNYWLSSEAREEDFIHHAFYDEEAQRIEMHLVSSQEIQLSSPYIQDNITIQKGERIHTENSHKFTTGDIHQLAGVGGLQLSNVFQDERGWCTVSHMVR